MRSGLREHQIQTPRIRGIQSKKVLRAIKEEGPRHCRSPQSLAFEVTLESLVFLDFEFSIDHIIVIRLG